MYELGDFALVAIEPETADLNGDNDSKLLGPAGLCFLRWLRIIREMRNISMYASNLGVLDSSPCPAPSELLLVAIETSDPVELLCLRCVYALMRRG